MKRINKISITVAATLTLVAAAGFAQYTGMDHGGNHGMMHDMNHGPGTGSGGNRPIGDAASAADATYGVQWQGALRAVHGGDTSGKAPLQPFAGKPNLYAVGPAAGLDGEVTVLAGIFHITRVRGGEIKTDSDLSASASFLVWAEVAAWQPPMPLGVKTDNHAQLEKHIEALALKAGIDTRKPFPFRLEGTFNSVDYHVLTPPANPAAGAAHNDSAKKIALKNAEVEVIGFYSKNHQGVFTHKGSHAHLHVVERNGHGGHVDEISAGAAVRISFPQ